MGSDLDRVAIHGVPRSGTSWLGELFNSSPHTIYRFQPLFSYALKGFVKEDSSSQHIDCYFENLVKIRDDFIEQSDARNTGLLPTFEKSDLTHIVYKEVRYHNVLFNLMQNTKNVKLIVLIRDPIAVLDSWIRAPREFRTDLGWEVEEEWRAAPKKNQGRSEEFFGFDGWKRAVAIFLQLRETFPVRVRLLSYKDLLSSTESEVAKLFEFCALEMTEQTTNFIKISRTRFVDNPYSVYRGSEAKRLLSSSLSDEIIEEIYKELEGYEFGCYLNGRP